MKSITCWLVSFGLVSALVFRGYAQNAIDVSLPNKVAEENTTVTIPIEVGDLTGRNVISYQAVITFDENVLDATGASSTGTISEPFGPPTVNTSKDGEINIGGFGTNPLSGSGTFVNLIFDVVGQPGTMTNLEFSEFIFNSGEPVANTQSGTFTVDMPVPVELVSFSGEITDNSVILKWITASETNNFGFEIERGTDGRTFSKIGFATGHGTTSIPQEYIFHDKTVQPGSYFYRLKQIDLDGTFEFSDEIRLQVDVPNEFVLEQNYPNPFNAGTIIKFHLAKETRVILNIYNLAGVRVKTLLDDVRVPGFYQVQWDGRDGENKMVTSGIYLYELKAENFRKSNKMIFLR